MIQQNNIEGFQPFSTDKVIGTYNLRDWRLTWKDMVYSKEVLANNVTVHRVACETTDGVFGWRVTGSGRYVTVDGIKLDPNTAKLVCVILFLTIYRLKLFVISDI